MARKKVRKSNKSAWIMVIAMVVAVVMILSTAVYYYLDYLKDPEHSDTGDDQIDLQQQLMAEQKRLLQEAEQLEQYIEEYSPETAVLDRLGSIYTTLAGYADWLEDSENGPAYMEKAAGVYRSLVEMEPEQVQYRFLLYSACNGLELEETGQQADSLKQLVEQKLAGGTLENSDRFYYALILDQEDGNRQGALDQLAVILNTEPEESSLHSYAQGYREQLESEDGASGGSE